MIFALEKPGAVAEDVIKLYSGFGVVTLAERVAVDDKQWEEKRRETIESMRANKQRDAIVAYVQRLRKEGAKDVRTFVRFGEDKPKEKEDAKKP